MRRSKIYLPVKLIEKSLDEDWLRSLGYYTLLKAVYKDGVFYKFSYGKVAKLIGCSAATLHHHIQVLQREGMVRFHGSNLTLLGNEKLKALADCRSVIAVPVDKKAQFDILRSQIIRQNLSRQAFRVRQAEKKKCTQRESYTLANKLPDNYVGLGTKKIGRLLNRSKMTGSRVRRKLQRMGILACEKVLGIILRGCSYTDFINLRNTGQIPAYAFFYRGVIVYQKHMAIQYTGNLPRALVVNTN